LAKWVDASINAQPAEIPAVKNVKGWNGKTKTKRRTNGELLRTAGIGKMPAKVDADRSRLRRLRK
jgi:hypothetical protein